MKIIEVSTGEYLVNIGVEFDSTENWSALDYLIEEEQIKSLTFDFENTMYVNSSAFGYTVNISQVLASKGATLKLINLCQKVSMVFKCLGGYELLNIED